MQLLVLINLPLLDPFSLLYMPLLYPLVNFCSLQHVMNRVNCLYPKHVACLLIRIEMKKDQNGLLISSGLCKYKTSIAVVSVGMQGLQRENGEGNSSWKDHCSAVGQHCKLEKMAQALQQVLLCCSYKLHQRMKLIVLQRKIDHMDVDVYCYYNPMVT